MLHRLAIIFAAIVVCVLAVVIARLPVSLEAKTSLATVSEISAVQSLGTNQLLDLTSRAALSVFLDKSGKMEVLLAKNANQPLPIASITKLITALTTLKYYPPDQLVTINQAAFVLSYDPAFTQSGGRFTLQSLLYPLLVESSNNAAAIIASETGEKNFIERMNLVAQEAGMNDSIFFNPSGLDPEFSPGGMNQATAYDLARLGNYLVLKSPDLLQITTLQGYQLFTSDGQFHHELKNTDKLLGLQDWPADIVGGKTGSTVLAKKNLLLILHDRQSGGYLINVVLGADDNFVDMKKLIDWVYSSYRLT